MCASAAKMIIIIDLSYDVEILEDLQISVVAAAGGCVPHQVQRHGPGNASGARGPRLACRHGDRAVEREAAGEGASVGDSEHSVSLYCG